MNRDTMRNENGIGCRFPLTRAAVVIAVVILILLTVSAPRSAAKPIPQATPAQGASDSSVSPDENVALAYTRTILTAEKLYKKRHNIYPLTLSTLAGTGSVTTRMVKTRERAGYRVGYSSSGETFTLSMVPVTFDAQHRAFYSDQTGVIRFEADKPATAQSAVFKQK